MIKRPSLLRACFLIAMAASTLGLPVAVQAQTWFYQAYNRGAVAFPGYVTLSEENGKSIFRMFFKNLGRCGQGNLEAQVSRTEDKTIVAPAKPFPDCVEEARYVFNNDGSKGKKEIKRDSDWIWDGLDRGMVRLSETAIAPSEAEVNALHQKLISSQPGQVIVPPGANVPKQCADFSGVWMGDWGRNAGKYWLWVLEVTEDCVARIRTTDSPVFPTAFGTTRIKNGVLEFISNQGSRESFELRGDELWARSTGSYGSFTTIYRRYQSGEK